MYLLFENSTTGNAILQVTGVKASLTKRLCDTSLGLSVHSLLLVDAIQTLGSNFELLAASHKNVTVDSVSGSLRGSDPVSPASPHSPMPPSASASMVPHKSTSPSDIARALSALQRSKVKAVCVLTYNEIGICHNRGCTNALFFYGSKIILIEYQLFSKRPIWKGQFGRIEG